MLNKAQVIGNIGQDPKITTAQSGRTVASFSVATTERGYTAADGTQVPEHTEWHNIVCFGRLGEIVQTYLHRGSKVFVEGKMRTRSYTDKTGIKRYAMEIVADSLEMLDPKPQTQQQQQQQPQQAQPLPMQPLANDNIPF